MFRIQSEVAPQFAHTTTSLVATVLRAAGCALAGGQASAGAELSLGFAISGLVDRGRVGRKGAMQPGDALILTKPIGAGTLLAAHRRGLARSRWVLAAVRRMILGDREAAAVLARHGVHAATDVTGLGLLGHLVEMARASGVEARVQVGSIPVLDGAREMAAAGVFPSVQPANMRQAVRNADAAQRLAIRCRQAEQPDLTQARTDQAQRHADCGALARAVGAQEPVHLARLHTERHVMHRALGLGPPTIGLAQGAQFERGRATDIAIRQNLVPLHGRQGRLEQVCMSHRVLAS